MTKRRKRISARNPQRLAPLAAIKQLDRIVKRGGSFWQDGARIIRATLRK